MSNLLPNQRVLVTAGASGIGLAIAQAFVRAGARVHVCDVDQIALDHAATENPGLTASRADVTSPADVDALASSIVRQWGGVDTVVNNAGIGGPRKPVEDVSDEEWSQVLAVNLTGMFNIVRRLVPGLKSQGGGAIVNISTSSTKTGLPLRTPYVVSKAAVEGLTRNLARELGPHNIRCNAILPGSIENERGRTLMRAKAEREGISYQEALERRLSFISMRSRIAPQEIGDVAVFLASDRAAHVTGQCLSVDGNIEWEG